MSKRFTRYITRPVCAAISNRFERLANEKKRFSHLYAKTAFTRYSYYQAGSTATTAKTFTKRKAPGQDIQHATKSGSKDPARLFSKIDYVIYYQELLDWDKALGSPLQLHLTPNAEIGELLKAEKSLLAIQLSRSTHRITPEGYEQLKKALELRDFDAHHVRDINFNGLPSKSSTAVAALASIGISSGMGLLAGLTSLETGIASLAVFYGTGMTYYNSLSSFTNGKAMTDYVRSRISTTWEEVFQERSIEDAMLVGMLSKFYTQSHSHSLGQYIDFTQLTPSQAYEVCKHHKCLPYKVFQMPILTAIESNTTSPLVPTTLGIKVPTVHLEKLHEHMQEVLHQQDSQPYNLRF